MDAGIIAVGSAFVGGGLTAIVTAFQKRKLLGKQEKNIDAKTDEIAVNTMRTALTTLNEELIKPIQEENKIIRNELKKLTNELTKFRKAIEKIPACAHADSCPVSRELQSNAKQS